MSTILPRAVMASALAVWLSGCGGPAPAGGPTGAPGVPGKSAAADGGSDSAPVVRYTEPGPGEAPAAAASQPNLIQPILGVTPSEPGTPALTPASAAGIRDEHTLRIGRPYTGTGHLTRAEREANRLRRNGFADAFVVDQGDQSVLCHGHYAAPRKQKNGPTEYPVEIGRDLPRLRKYLDGLVSDDAVGADLDGPRRKTVTARPLGIPLDIVPTPLPAPKNHFLVGSARGEWTLHWMSVYGTPDSKIKAMTVAEEIQKNLRLPVFVIPNAEQYLICVGDLPADAIEIKPVDVPISVLPRAVQDRLRTGRPIVNSRTGEYLTSDTEAIPKTETARKLWEQFGIFLNNGEPMRLPAEVRNRSGKGAHVMSQWIRISELKGLSAAGGRASGDLDDLIFGERRGEE